MENFETYKLDQTGQQTQAILDQVSTNTADIEQLRALYEALTQNEPVIIQPSDTWPVADPQENVIYRVIDRVNTPPQSYSDYMWNGTSMVLMATYNNSIDNEPTPGSNNLVKSGGVAASIIFDISAYHATGSTLATYSNLAAALGADGANVPASVRKGGMSIKFVLTSDNKYIQARCMAQNFTTDVVQWQGVDDEPTAGSDNLVKSEGVYNAIENAEVNRVSNYNKTTALQKSRTIDADTSKIAEYINTHGLWYVPCKTGEYIDVSKDFQEVTWASYIYYGYTAIEPETGVDVIELGRKEGATHLEYHGVAPINGYFVIEMYNNANNLGLEISIGHLIKSDVNTLKENVVELQEDIVPANVFFGENLIADKSNARKGQYLNDGTWSAGDGGSSATRYVSDYVDVTNIEALKIKGASFAGRLLITAFNSSKEVLLSNSVVADKISDYIIWNKRNGTKYISVSYDSTLENYCYSANSENELIGLNLGITNDNRNLLDVYGVNAHYAIKYDGTIDTLGGSSSTFATSGFINVSGVSSIRVKGDAYANGAGTGYLNLAAYDENLTLIPNKCVRGMGNEEFVWSNDGNVNYVRIGYNTAYEHYCYNCSVFLDYTDKNKIKNVLNPDDAAIVQLNDKPNMLTKLQNAIWGTVKPLSILHFSDIHGGKDELQRLIDFKSYFSNYIDIILNTGDTVDNSFADGIAWYEDVQGSGNILNVIGNHDNAAIVGGELDMEAHTGKECYDAYIAPFAENWNATFPTDAATAGKCYYYKDFATQNLRLIIVDVMHYDNTQDGWLADVLSDAKTNQLSVVIAAHNTPVGIDYVECSFSSKIFTGFNGVSWSESASMWTTVQTFIDAGGKFLCYLVGHTHADIVTVGHDYPKQLAIYVTTATTTHDEESKRVKWTKTEDDFNIVSFDTTRNIIKVIKVGCDYNAAMQHRDVLSIKVDYTAADKYTIMSE